MGQKDDVLTDDFKRMEILDCYYDRLCPRYGTVRSGVDSAEKRITV